MTVLRTLRLNADKLHDSEIDYFVKLENEDGKVEGTFDITGDGVYYYRPKSSVLSPSEEPKHLDSYDGYISFEILKEIFENLLTIGWNRDKHDIIITKQGKQFCIKMVDAEF